MGWLSARLAIVLMIVSSCSLFTSLDNLSGGAPDGGTSPSDAQNPDDGASSATPDARADRETSDASTQHQVTLVQRATLDYRQEKTFTRQLDKPLTAGNLLAAVMLTHNQADAGAAYAISDVLANTWKSTTFRECQPSHIGIQLWYVESTKGGVDAITVSQSLVSPPYGELGLGIFEYSGIAEANALDGEIGQCAPLASAAMSTPPLTTTETDLLLGLFADPCGNGTMTVGLGWSLVDLLPAYYYLLESQDQGGAGMPPGSYQATATDPQTASCWVSSIAAFKLR